MSANEKRIEELENKMFYLSMKDHWSNEDFEQNREWRREIERLRNA